MSYTAEISRSNPSCFLFLIDQSGSMQEVMDPSNMQPLERPVVVDGQQFTHTAAGKTKAQTLSDVVNRLLTNMVIKCTKSEGVRDYYHIGVIGYGGDNTANRVQPAFAGSLAGRELVPIHEIAETPARVEERNKKVDDGAGGLVEQKTKFPIWLDPVAAGGTPMCGALMKAHSIISDWTSQHQSGYPPIVINMTDGESTDGDPTEPAGMVTGLTTNDGNVLLFNIHISTKQGAKVEFPETDSALVDDNARKLFAVSSIIPPRMQDIAKQEGIAATEMTRGFAFNADLVALVRFLDIGTRPSNLR